MPTVNGKKYPYTTAGKLAAKKAGAKKSSAAKALKTAGMKLDNAGKAVKGVPKAATMAGNKRSAARKAATKGMLQPRTPAQIRKMQTGMANATKKRKAGKGQQK